jgi:hypothetical protein
MSLSPSEIHISVLTRTDMIRRKETTMGMKMTVEKEMTTIPITL